MFFGFAVLCLAALPIALGGKLHKRMTIEQVAETFQTPYGSSVPDYEVVQFHGARFNKRGTRSPPSLRLKAFGGSMKLWLEPNDGILAKRNIPVYEARRSADKKDITYTKIPNAMKNIGTVLVDPKKKASLVVKRDAQGLYSMDGYIGSENLVVRSLPDAISRDLMETHDPESLKSSRTTRSAYHIVFKREAKHLEGRNESLRFNYPRSRVARVPTPKPKTPAPTILYPEIMVVVDYGLSLLIGNSNDKILTYVLGFWNGVDLLYRRFENPKFRFNIARIIIAKESTATPYISDNLKNDLIPATKTLDASKLYYFQKLNIFPSTSYDVVATMTSFEMLSHARLTEPDTVGVASQKGACNVDNARTRVMSTMIAMDDGSFKGIATAAHEFAHLLGAVHDTDVNPACLDADGYIMAESSDIITNGHDFSSCSVTDINKFLKETGASCFHNKPIRSKVLARILPGSLRSRDHQCNTLMEGWRNCYTGPTNQAPCTKAYCEDPDVADSCVSNPSFAPPDGAFCDRGKVCIHRQCMAI